MLGPSGFVEILPCLENASALYSKGAPYLLAGDS